MFKKLGTLVLTAAVSILGFQAVPAQAAANDAIAESFADQSVTFNTQFTSGTAVTVPANASWANWTKSWSINGSALTAANAGGKTLSLEGYLLKPDNTKIEINSANMSSSNMWVNMNVNTSGMPINATTSPSVVVPATDFTSAYVSVNFNIGGRDMNGAMQTAPAGSYTVVANIKLDGVAIADSTNFSDLGYVQESSFNFSLAGSSVTIPTGYTAASPSALVCIDSSKLSVGDVLTAGVYVGGTLKSNGNSMWNYRAPLNNAWRNSSNNTQWTTTVAANDITYGLSANMNARVTGNAGDNITPTFQVLNQNSVNVTGACAPAKAAKPTVSYSNGVLMVSAAVPAFGDSSSNDCQLFDAAAPTTVVATRTSAYSMNGSTFTCSFNTGLVTGHSYFAQVRGGYNGTVKGAWSDSSDPVVKTAAGVNFTTAVSGLSNQGGKLALVSATTPADETATMATYPDGGAGVLVLAANQASDPMAVSPTTGFTLRHLTPAGADATFAGTGSATYSAGMTDYISNGRAGWYGNRDKWVITASNYPVGQGMSSPEARIVTGTNAAAATATFAVPASVLTGKCVDTFGAGYLSTQNGGMMSPPTVSVTPVSAPTSVPLYMVNCYKSNVINGIPMSLAMQMIVTIADANTVSLVVKLGTPAADVNTTSFAASANPTAGDNDAALTLFVRTIQQTSQVASTVTARSIVTIKKDLSVSTLTSTWAPVTLEPVIRVAATNDGTVWGLLQEGAAVRLFKLSGDTLTTKDVALDANADLTNSNVSLPWGAQAGNSALLTVQRTVSTGAALATALATIDTATGALTTYEVAKFSYSTGPGVISAYGVESKNLYWYQTNGAEPTKYSIYRWRDPAYVPPANNQTITWTTSPSSMTAGGTVTVAATATSGLAVVYGTTDANICTVNASTGVVTAVATSGTCVVTANQAGNGSYAAAGQKTLSITITAVAPVKQAPKVPAVATKLKIGKTITVALSATKGSATKGANVDGLATTVTVSPATKAFCSVVAVKKAAKVTGYTVKGLKAGKCLVVVTITGNATYNALTKTVPVTVSK